MSEMIDRVAHAIYKGRNGHGCKPWRLLTKAHKAPYIGDAREALVEIRDPTEAMVKAGVEYALRVTIGGDYKWTDYIKDKHKIMIDAAINERGKP